MALDGLLDKPLPSSPEAERIILGAILLDNNIFRQTAALSTNDFYTSFHRWVYAAMLELAEENQPLEPVLIGAILKREISLENIGGIARIANLTYGLPQFSSVAPYVRELREKTARREAFKKITRLQSGLVDESLPLKEFCAGLAQLESELRTENAEETDSFKPLREVFMTDVLPTLDAYFRQEQTEFLISTGFPDIDKALGGGLYLSDFLAIVAPPKSAKSAFALQLALNFAKSGETVGLLSLEMSNLQNGLRFIAQESYRQSVAESGSLHEAISATHLRPGIYETTYRQARKVAESLFETNLYLCQKPLTWHELQAETRRLVKEKNLRVIIVDYWQLVNHNRRGSNRAENLAEIAKGLKQLAQELNICVVALGQFNQEGLKLRAKGGELDALYLEGSGELVKSANIVLTIDIQAADLLDASAPRQGTLTFKPLRSAADARLNCFFWGKYLTVEITGSVSDEF